MMTRNKLVPVSCLIVRFYLGAVFLAACYHKILNPYAFAIDVATYDILPLSLVNLMTVALPWVELLAGLLVISGVAVRPSVLMMGGMMIMFIIALSLALSRGLDMSCGCFASADVEAAISWKTLVRDLFWTALCAYVYFCDRNPVGIRMFRRKP
ncbi:MAG: hypothetical protein A2268_14800 [Candidatus Raymondbacteria bacterium RifOxyA12_full_50_37]|uniref:Methylamine utilisation protein MauE domain-containing protein n=1 Tax=Candidatus Raymondbacteria bacterium RIFOXYD12_FULL_49_13 TaxID=1817890 RepID=A0A1F7F2U1_UNCRA|nr:MAG: hypothetical protein A2268_14800 [Candidatus Raymondbacteria bacterium RifOxyA12_full_50_37]OGJ87852.1 MAG: hypothetical protein A2350_12745 [Candidatus Raymondbacteria bacterium RifOxyB12_full_50_8]OGJ88713.1 MAG: hypothetical protein A2248_20735 [Candidatus Raymondbacteria bacterium RIFOXYA2_FULL_49_16]OGK00883.1 MAG: hypothetical protein A2519_07990 [Candidatus Raymondbacteria bacterium RIFOXYD12_FULL_49_13]OGP41750.1 MAG: hypothetical protein A2324_07825 [Candidatus Raymondbacteria 